MPEYTFLWCTGTMGCIQRSGNYSDNHFHDYIWKSVFE